MQENSLLTCMQYMGYSVKKTADDRHLWGPALQIPATFQLPANTNDTTVQA